MTTSVSVSRARAFALLLAALIAGGSFVLAVPSAMAPLTGFSVTPGQYSHPGLIRHPYVYVPGEVISFSITGNVVGETFDAVVIVRSSGANLRAYDDVAIPAGGTVSLTYTVPNDLPDGDNYQIEVGTNTYIATACCRLQFRRFAVQSYELNLEVNRPAFLGGDDVTMLWSANYLKNGSLAADGFGQMWVYDAMGTSLITPGVHTFSAASGSFTFTLPSLADPRFDGIVQAWFNDTTSNPVRFQESFAFFDIDYLSVIVNVAQNQYPPGGIVSVYVTTTVSFDQANPSIFDPPEPDSTVAMSVWEIPPAPASPIEHSQYRGSGLVTDAHGQLTYVFKLDTDPALNGKNFEVRANASRGIWQWEGRDTFAVSAAAGITQVLQFNQNEYQAGDTATVTSIVSGAGSATLTYIYEVRDTTSTPCSNVIPWGSLLATDTRSQNSYSYQLPTNFAGQICFRVTADDGQGNRVTSAQEFSVVFGWLLVNADRQDYNPGDTITVSWELRSNRIDPATATYYYEVRDRDGNLVTSGTTGNTPSFQFPVPPIASSMYAFTITATTADGRSVAGAISLNEVRGFFITISFDRSSYAPGDSMRVHYRISQRSTDSAYPNTFVITYGLLSGSFGGSTRVLSTSSREGDLTYTVPAGIDEGSLLFQVSEANTGSLAIESVTIRGGLSVWGAVAGDVPVVVILMILWLLLITFVMWRRGVLGGGMGAPKAPKEPSGPSKSEPVYAPPSTPMTVTCRSCGSPIEITTSKRPIEVMCPKCGNTEMVS